MAPTFELVVCITSTALFDCNESHEIWQREGLEAYKAHQRDHVAVPLPPGVAFPLVRSLLQLNVVAGRNLVEVVLVSRNDSEAGERVRQSINHHKLRITRMSFTGGTDVTQYLPAWQCDLFLSTDETQVRKVLSGSDMFDGIAAALVCNIGSETVPLDSRTLVQATPPLVSPWPDGQVRIAFDGDGVLFSDEADRVAKEHGLEAFYQFEQDRGQTALPKGPMKAFALKLQKIRQVLGEEEQWRVRTFLVTARNDVANLRVFHTLKEWALKIDETHFLGGLDKTPFLRSIDPAIYFDDSRENIDRARLYVPSAYVVYGIQTLPDVTTPTPAVNALPSAKSSELPADE